MTFLDGTTVTVEPSSDVTVREMDVGGRERSRIEILITAGTVWARIANLLGGRGTVSLASNTHAAIAQDGLIGAEQRLDGSFACWTRAGTVQLVDAGGTALGQSRAGSERRPRPTKPRLGDGGLLGPPERGSGSSRGDLCGRSS